MSVVAGPLRAADASGDESAGAASSSSSPSVAYRDLEKFSKILNFLESQYVDEVKSKDLMESAIRGMLQDLDPHSAYLDKEVYGEMQTETSGKFQGLGVEVAVQGQWLTVLSPIDDTPASRAGLQPGDRIVSIGGKSTKGLGLQDAINLMRGKAGAPVVLTIQRGDSKKSFDVSLKREPIKLRSVKSDYLDDETLYLRISSFMESTAADLEKVLKEAKNKKGLKGMILDLRGNPGGLLNQAVRVVNLFVDDGIIVYTMGRDKKKQDIQYAQRGVKMTTLPLIVIINGGSASAAEIVSGALQDLKRAVVVGSKSFGKGSVQTVLPLGDESAIKVTIARYYLASGRSIQAKGIDPDIEVLPIDAKIVNELRLAARGRKEEDLRGHISDGTSSEDSPVSPDRNTPNPLGNPTQSLKDRLKEDYVVQQARGFLKVRNTTM